MTDLDACTGVAVGELPTPVAVIDLDRLERNIHRLAGYAREHGIALWPHTKTHKMPPVARMQLDAGAGGLTVAKLGEAEVMAAHALGPLLLHYPVYGPDKWRRLTDLAGRCDLTVALDSLETAEPIAASLAAHGRRARVLIELDVGHHRTGVATPAAAAELAGRIDRLDGLDVAGVSCFPGHVRGTEAEIDRSLTAVEDILAETVARFDRAGLCRDRVSGGCTPGMLHSHRTPSLTELRAGTYVFLDRSEVAYDGPLTLDDCALAIHATVVSAPAPGRAVVDAGSKTLSDAVYLGPGGNGNGAIVGDPEVKIKLTEEHGICDTSSSVRSWRVGDRVEIVPNHVCAAVNLQDAVCAARNGVVEYVWTVEGRGKVR
ncbi:MAG TPA: alanine racemase [Gaiellales bacterium]|nr:alanine racemase [Gaiellales bacterium]